MIDALNAVGAIATLEEVAGIGHHSLDDPEHVGDPVVVWLEQYPASRGRPVTVLRGHRTRSSFGPHRAGWTGGDQRTLMAT